MMDVDRDPKISPEWKEESFPRIEITQKGTGKILESIEYFGADGDDERALVGLARTGATMSNGSGDYVIAFSTAASVRREAGAPTPRPGAFLTNDDVSPLFQAVAEATEEAIYNSLFRATTVGDVEALPLDQTMDVLRKYNAVRAR